jgi:hypothetical protein
LFRARNDRPSPISQSPNLPINTFLSGTAFAKYGAASPTHPLGVPGRACKRSFWGRCRETRSVGLPDATEACVGRWDAQKRPRRSRFVNQAAGEGVSGPIGGDGVWMLRASRRGCPGQFRLACFISTTRQNTRIRVILSAAKDLLGEGTCGFFAALRMTGKGLVAEFWYSGRWLFYCDTAVLRICSILIHLECPSLWSVAMSGGFRIREKVQRKQISVELTIPALTTRLASAQCQFCETTKPRGLSLSDGDPMSLANAPRHLENRGFRP